MCFGKPKPPPPVVGDPELARQTTEARAAAQAERASAKDKRLADALSRIGGRYGRSSLFTDGAGGAGYAAPAARSLFQQV